MEREIPDREAALRGKAALAAASESVLALITGITLCIILGPLPLLLLMTLLITSILSLVLIRELPQPLTRLADLIDRGARDRDVRLPPGRR